tara:strand:+ start:528 stop:1595 length:1068 start_codon:yes stop_codon:yes gene_type:complete
VIIHRYLICEILKPLIAVCSVLIIIFVSYKSDRYLADVIEGLLPANIVISLLFLKATIAMEVLLPITLYLSVVIGLGRLHASSEMTALFACGASPKIVLRSVFVLSLMLAILVGTLSLFVRPWAYEKSYHIIAQAETNLDFSQIRSGHFYEKQHGTRVVFVDYRDDSKKVKDSIFTLTERDNVIQAIFAKHAYQETSDVTGEKTIVFVDGHRYTLSRNGSQDRIVRFGTMTIRLKKKEPHPEYQRKATPTLQLATSIAPYDIAEFQWRLSTAVSTILLGLLGIPLSRASPRQGKYPNLLTAVIIYVVYYNVGAVARNWVEQEVIDPMPGIWWVNALLACTVILWFSLSPRKEQLR